MENGEGGELMSQNPPGEDEALKKKKRGMERVAGVRVMRGKMRVKGGVLAFKTLDWAQPQSGSTKLGLDRYFWDLGYYNFKLDQTQLS